MANILSSKLVTFTFPALALILSLCVSNCLAFHKPCRRKIDCFDISLDTYCWHGRCCKCEFAENFENGKCLTNQGVVTKFCGDFILKEWIKTYGIAIIVPLVVIGGVIAACCFFVSGCPGYHWRKRNQQQAQFVAQTNVNPNLAQYPSQPQFVAPNPNRSNVSVQGGYGSPQYPFQQQQQQQYAYLNMNQNYGQGQYPNQYGAPPPPPNYSQYPNQYPPPPPNYSQHPTVPVQARGPAQKYPYLIQQEIVKQNLDQNPHS